MDFVIDQPKDRRMFIATFESFLYEVELHDNELKLKRFQEIHDAPVSCIEYLPLKQYAQTLAEEFDDAQFSINLGVVSDFIVTASFDWSIKIFEVEDLDSPAYQLNYHKDFVSCMHVNPVNPYLLASADSDGVLAIWDLRKKTSEPIFNWKAPYAISTVKWNQTGDQIAVCNCKGGVRLMSARKALVNLKEDAVNGLVQNGFEPSSV